ncbi:MAG: mechanosensitive ion channel domain-containing protein [Cyanobacteria bacterium P01_F01_bin.86]
MKWGGWFLAALGLTWLLLSQPSQSQLTQPELEAEPVIPSGTATIVVDGRAVFDIHGADGLSAIDRAARINAELQQEVRLPEPVEIEIREHKKLVYLTSEHGADVLITVTAADVPTPGYPLKRQAIIWEEQLEQAIGRSQQERGVEYLHRAALYSIAVLLSAIALHVILQFVRRWGARYLNRWFNTKTFISAWERPLKLFWQLALLGLKLGLWLTVFFYITDVFPQARHWRYTIYNSLTAEAVVLGNSRYSALELMLLLGFTIGLWFAANAIARLFRLYVLSRARFEQRIQDILSVLVKYALIFLGVIVLLQIWGIDASSLAILASVLGVGIGFGVQNITNNFISGFIITLERPIQVGDFVNVAGLVGTVRRIGARSTEIRTLDQVAIIVPNSRFLESEVINWSHGTPISRLRVPVGVAYGSDIALVQTALLEAIKRHPDVLLRPKPEIWFQGFGESSLDFEIMVWTGEPRQQFRVKSDLNYKIEASLRRHGIQIPFPQRDLHLRSPQLDELVGLLKQQVAGSANGHIAESLAARPSQPAAGALPEPTDEPDESSSESANVLSNLDLEALAEAMQEANGVPIYDHHYQSHIYPDSFTGSAVVEWLVQNRDYTREGAIRVGQWLLQKGLIQGVLEPDFRDGYHFYQFYRESPSDIKESSTTRSESVASNENMTDTG